MKLIGAAHDDDGVYLYPAELAAERAKCDRRVLDGLVEKGQLQVRHEVDAIARAHSGSGRKPRIGYVAEDVEVLRREWFEAHAAVDPDEVTGTLGSAREDALEHIVLMGRYSETLEGHLDSVHHAALALVSTCSTVGGLIGWEP